MLGRTYRDQFRTPSTEGPGGNNTPAALSAPNNPSLVSNLPLQWKGPDSMEAWR